MLTSPLRVTAQLAAVPQLTLLDAVNDRHQLERDDPFLQPLCEEVVVARLRAGHGLVAV